MKPNIRIGRGIERMRNKLQDKTKKEKKEAYNKIYYKRPEVIAKRRAYGQRYKEHKKAYYIAHKVMRG